MPSKGSPIVLVRFTPGELLVIDARIEQANRNRAGEPWTRSEFVRVAVREKLAKMERSRRSKRAAAGEGLGELQGPGELPHESAQVD